MSDFKFIHNKESGLWTILSPRRAKRPDSFKTSLPSCPFCPISDGREPSIFSIKQGNTDQWAVKVLQNKYPFTPIHEIIIHSPDHHKSFDELSLEQIQNILKAYQNRFTTHQLAGNVYIFHNRGEAGGESLSHPHSQLNVIPLNIKHSIQLPLEPENDNYQTEFFYIFCPITSQWPDEVWITPKRTNTNFAQISAKEISDLALILNKIFILMDLRHGHEFPCNFYIYPENNWYLRIIPRTKSLGGFELGTGIYINTQDPTDTMYFIKENFEKPDEEKIRKNHSAGYRLKV